MTDTALHTALAEGVARLAGHDPDWLAEARLAALARFEESTLPSRVAHLWRYTDPARIEPGERELAMPDAEQDAVANDWERVAGTVACHDGAVRGAVLDPALAERGVVLSGLRAAAASHANVVRERFATLRESCDGAGARYDHLSAAAFAGGTFLHVPRGVAVDRPVRIRSHVAAAGLVAARNLIMLDQGAEATVVVDFTSEDGATSLLHEATEVFLGAGARLTLITVQLLGRKVSHAPIVRGRVERDGALETVAITLGGRQVKSLQTAELVEPGADVQVRGIVFGDGRQHFDHHTFQDHVAHHTTSNLDYRVVVGGRARSAYTGRLRIGLAGAGCDAHQSNHNLVLSEKARADTIPELEILTDDVSCSHAAAVGPIDEEQVYFCQSRGLSGEEARRTIVRGFLEPLVARIPGERLLERVRGTLDTRLEGIRA